MAKSTSTHTEELSPAINAADAADRSAAAASASATATSVTSPLGELSFEQALEELDTLVRKMESGKLSLDDSLAAYRRGTELARFCQQKLADAEQEIAKLDNGELKPIDPAELRGGR